MSTEDNKTSARDFLEGGMDPSMLAEEATFWNPLMGTLPRDAMVAAPGVLAKAFASPMSMTIDGITAEGDRVAVEARSNGDLVDGNRYSNVYHFLFEFNASGKITRIREHCDSKHFAETLAPLLQMG
jgi:ketosteroid isomerase-like protein